MSVAEQESTLSTKTTWAWFALLWFIGIVPAYFLTSFFSNFYPSLYQFILLSLLFQFLCGIGIFLFFSETGQNTESEKHNDLLTILVLLIALALGISAIMISWQFPGLFHRRILFMDSSLLSLFAVLSLISLGISILFLKTANWDQFSQWLKQTQFFKFTQENLPGILLSIFFLLTYFIFAETINFPGFRTLDEYFDMDISEWLARLVPQNSLQDVRGVRAVHPAVLIFFRLLVWFISIFLHGDRLHAVFIMHALAGAACVFLTWLIIKRSSGNTAYALIIASLLGASNSHLLLSSMLETYIYSALAILLFILLIQSERTSLKFTVPAGILVFGITVTNLLQTCILYFFKYPRMKVIIKYVLIVVFFTAVLNVLQVWLYPNTKLFFLPSNLLHEQLYVSPLDSSWRMAGRFALIARAIPLYGMIAPTPFVLTKEIGMEYPNFRTYQILLGEFHVAGYRGLADVTVKLWIMILVVASILFILDLFKSPKQVLFPLSLALCLGFSFFLHLVYGDDPMLYSPNWVYALVLFVALTFQKWADRRWLQLLMTIFLILLINTNLRLIYQIMYVSAPYFSK